MDGHDGHCWTTCWVQERRHWVSGRHGMPLDLRPAHSQLEWIARPIEVELEPGKSSTLNYNMVVAITDDFRGIQQLHKDFFFFFLYTKADCINIGIK